jgi:hypothetical protein
VPAYLFLEGFNKVKVIVCNVVVVVFDFRECLFMTLPKITRRADLSDHIHLNVHSCLQLDVPS